eukprot:s1036_g1.t1
MCRLVMLNDHNWCFANSTIYGMIWCLLSLPISCAAAWGSRRATLVSFLSAHTAMPAVLKDLDWFCRIIHSWGCSQGQQDCAEFTHRVLTWLNAPAFDMRWERRLETADGIHVSDRSDNFIPLQLQFTHDLHAWGTCELNDLVNIWCQENSHVAALLDAPPCLCVHLDRGYQDSDGLLTKTDCCITLDTEISFPVFKSTGLLFDKVGYIPVAAAAHLGTDRAGHYYEDATDGFA